MVILKMHPAIFLKGLQQLLNPSIIYTFYEAQEAAIITGGGRTQTWLLASTVADSLSLSHCLLVTGMLDVLGRRVWLRIQDQVGQSNYVAF